MPKVPPPTESRFTRVSVFCGSSSGKKNSYAAAAVELAQELVNAHAKALQTLSKRQAANPVEADDLVRKWADQLLSKSFDVIQKFLSKEEESKRDDGFLTPPGTNAEKVHGTTLPSETLTQVVTAIYTIGSLVIICPSIDLKEIVQVLHGIITSGSNGAKASKIPISTISIKQRAPSMYVQAWLTMGKICLADAKLAKRYIPLLMQELEKSDSETLCDNIVVMMADFCIRLQWLTVPLSYSYIGFTRCLRDSRELVRRQTFLLLSRLLQVCIGKFTRCLRDSCESVRRQIFILLSRLLQADYVKWRGVLFLRFLLSLVDESEKIRELADFFFGNILKAKAPLLAYDSFVEAVYFLNDCHIHSGNDASQKLRAENRIFSIRGNDERSRSKRMHIYTCLLKQMAPEQLLAAFAKIAAGILAAASDGTLRIDDPTGQSVLQDAFEILSCKEIRITKNRGSASESADEEPGEVGAAAAVRGKIITQAVKKSLIQNTIPIFIELKRLLESKNSPLVGSLMECLRVILKDYKNEIDEILVADKQLQKELIHDMKKYETTKAKSTAMEKEKLGTPKEASGFDRSAADARVASAIADVVAEARARSVMREVNLGLALPPLSSVSKPKVKSMMGADASKGARPNEVLKRKRRRQGFESDDES